jgi:ATP-dependent RNA helicase RhlE
MLKLGFYDDLIYIKKILKQRHQTMFFSATIDDEIKKLAYAQIKSDAIRIQISPKDPVSKNVKHGVLFVKQDEKRFYLLDFLVENPQAKVIIFVRTKVRIERIKKFLDKNNIVCDVYHSGLAQTERERALENFRENKFNILVATDISARGIDIANVTNVINYDLPEIAENYVHRIGRTGRGTNKGEAISFCGEEEEILLKNIENYTGYQINKVILDEQTRKKAEISTLNDNKSLQKMILDTEKHISEKAKKRRK